MIKFFRQLRQGFISEGKTKKYLLYAIGEIILVVIGILIALQINNWNENRKDRFLEQKILQSLNNDLATDIINMKFMISYDSIVNENNMRLVKVLNDSLSGYKSSYSFMFGNMNRYALFYPQKMGYETLTSKGLEILRNDSLKSQIVNLYDWQYAMIAESMDLKKQLYLETNLIFNPHFQTIRIDTTYSNVGFSVVKIPNDFKALKHNKEFMGNFTHITIEQSNFIYYDTNILEQMKTTKTSIANELLHY